MTMRAIRKQTLNKRTRKITKRGSTLNGTYCQLQKPSFLFRYIISCCKPVVYEHQFTSDLIPLQASQYLGC
jgi:hypothetical protein